MRITAAIAAAAISLAAIAAPAAQASATGGDAIDHRAHRGDLICWILPSFCKAP